MKRIAPILIGITIALLVDSSSSLPAAELTDSEFQRLHKLLQPPADEPWRTIPWKIALLDAQKNAVAENKPIFIWAMDGHPLGCT